MAGSCSRPAGMGSRWPSRRPPPELVLPRRPKALAAASMLASIRGDIDEAFNLLDEAARADSRLALNEPWVPMVGATVTRDLDRQLHNALEVQRRSERLPFFRHVGLAQEASLRA